MKDFMAKKSAGFYFTIVATILFIVGTVMYTSVMYTNTVVFVMLALAIIWEVLAEEVGKDLDPFDMLCHVVYGQPPLTRKERAENVRKRNYFTKYSEAAQAVLDNLLDKYADAGVQEIESIQVLKLKPFDSMGTLPEIIKTGFGDRNGYNQALSELENEIYQLPPRSA